MRTVSISSASLSVSVIVAVLVVGIGVVRADWPNWRGPNHDGISTETNVNVVWSGSPTVLWEYEIGSGFSSMAAVGDRVFTAGTRDKKQMLFCFDAATGKVIWDKPVEGELPERQGGDGPRATPTIDDGRVYFFGARGTFLCADAKTGKTI